MVTEYTKRLSHGLAAPPFDSRAAQVHPFLIYRTSQILLLCQYNNHYI